jgi:hypothetical protein
MKLFIAKHMFPGVTRRGPLYHLGTICGLICGLAGSAALAPAQATRHAAAAPHLDTAMAADSVDPDQICRDSSGAAVLAGTVDRADTSTPATGAAVTLTWREMDLSSEGITKRQVHLGATVGADGHYHICGLPDALVANFQVSYHGQKSPVMRVTAAPNQTVIQKNVTVSADAIGHAVLRGHVLTANGTPIVGATVRLLTRDAPSTQSDASGAFTLTDLPAGTQEVAIRALRYVPVVGFVELRTATPLVRNIQLDTLPTTLQEVIVGARPSPRAEAAGYYDRLAKKRSTERFITHEQVLKSKAVTMMDVFRHVPGLRIYTDEHGEDSVGALPPRHGIQANSGYGLTPATQKMIDSVNRLRDPYAYRHAPPTAKKPSSPDTLGSWSSSHDSTFLLGQYSAKFYIDGIPATQQQLRELLPEEVAGIEIYRDGRMAPPGFAMPGLGGAAETVVVLIWTLVGG